MTGETNIMAKDLNKWQGIGRLGKDPEGRYTQSGKAVTSFSVACGNSWKDANGEKHEDTEWVNIVAWDKLGEICNSYLTKGSRVYLEGRLTTRKWEDKEGNTRYTTEIVLSDMIMLDSKRADDDTATSADKPLPPRPQAIRQPARNAPQQYNSDEDLPF
jgi:single-strand DNA-binding protein